MVLCRNNAPLVYAYNEFIKMGKKATIRGKEFANALKATIRSSKSDELNINLTKSGLFVSLYDNLFNTRDKLMRQHNIDKETAMMSPIIENKLDIIKTLEVLSDGINTRDELIERVEEVFPKKSKNEGISLSTVHKAKGLEAENVCIICPSLMPSKSAKQKWEIMQEKNLMYVAYTRAKKKLCFVDETGFTNLFNQKVGKGEDFLNKIEEKVNKVLGKTTKVIINESTAKTIIQNASNIKLPQPKTRAIDINDKKKETSLSGMFSRNKIKRKKNNLTKQL
jgi:superfamily I DNA/RNA helicase